MGYDSHEDITFEVAKFSLEQRASVPVEVIPLKRAELQVRPDLVSCMYSNLLVTEQRILRFLTK